MPRPARILTPCRSMIVAPQPEAVESGRAALASGGNAVDAVLACAFTQVSWTRSCAASAAWAACKFLTLEPAATPYSTAFQPAPR